LSIRRICDYMLHDLERHIRSQFVCVKIAHAVVH
jgi:hypothetical protein